MFKFRQPKKKRWLSQSPKQHTKVPASSHALSNGFVRQRAVTESIILLLLLTIFFLDSQLLVTGKGSYLV